MGGGSIWHCKCRVIVAVLASSDYSIQDSTPKCRIVPSPRSKVHQMKYVSHSTGGDQKDDVLAVSTEDGRVVFYSTVNLQEAEEDSEATIPYATPLGQVGGKQAGFPGRVKDFEIMSLEEQVEAGFDGFLVVTGSSDGVVRIWKITEKDLVLENQSKDAKNTTRQIGKLLSSYETGNRITCLASFIMLPAEDSSTLFDSEEDVEEDEEKDESSDEDE